MRPGQSIGDFWSDFKDQYLDHGVAKHLTRKSDYGKDYWNASQRTQTHSGLGKALSQAM